MANQVLLKHELSNLGLQSVILRPFASDLYKIISSTGLLDYIKKSDHLGVISASHPSNNHKRWDYVVLQLKLLQSLKNSPINSGLSSSIKELSGISGEDFLQCCIILSNLGHITGTVSSERSLLSFLKTYDSGKANFLSNISKEKFKTIIEDVFTENDYYKIKYLIVLNYLSNYTKTEGLIEVLNIFLKNPIEKDSIKIGKLKMLFFKIRRIAFVYLDGFNSDFPLHISITKIMLDINNYEHLFNPNSTDFETFFKHSEEALTKKLYININTSFLHYNNSIDFEQYLSNRKSRLNFKNLLYSLSHQKTPYEFKRPLNNRFKFQAYFSNSDINDFSNIVSLDFKHACKEYFNKEKEFELLLNKGLNIKTNSICILNDNRKDLAFINMFFDKFRQTKDDTRVTLRNLNVVSEQIFNQLKFSGKDELKEFFEPVLQNKNRKAYIRKYLHFIIKYLIHKKHYSENGDFNVFIKFDYLRSVIKNNYNFNETAYFTKKQEILKSLALISSDVSIPSDLINNLGIIKHIIESKSKLKKNQRYFCSFFPYEVEQVTYDPKQLEKTSSALVRKVITDIDAILVIFNDTYFELYIIEGKDVKRGLNAIVMAELNRIRDMFQFPALFTLPQVINETGARGGYLLCSNKT